MALVPAIGALVGMGAVILWRNRQHVWARLTLAGIMAVTALWSFVLLQRTPDWYPWLGPVVLIAGPAVAALLAVEAGEVGCQPRTLPTPTTMMTISMTSTAAARNVVTAGCHLGIPASGTGSLALATTTADPVTAKLEGVRRQPEES